jgi:hypothetical protein
MLVSVLSRFNVWLFLSCLLLLGFLPARILTLVPRFILACFGRGVLDCFCLSRRRTNECTWWMRSFNGIQLFYFSVHLAFKALKVWAGALFRYPFVFYAHDSGMLNVVCFLVFVLFFCFFRLESDWLGCDWVDDWKDCFNCFHVISLFEFDVSTPALPNLHLTCSY